MAVKRALLHLGQSNDEAVGDHATWSAEHPELDISSSVLFPSTLPSIGAYPDLFTIPGNIPGFTTPRDIRLQALSGVRYLTFYHPLASGYKTYPCVGRSRAQTTHPTLTVEQQFQTAALGMQLTRHKDRSTHQIISVTPNVAGATVKIAPTSSRTLVTTDTGTETLTLSATHGWATDTPVALAAASGGTLPTGAGIAEGVTLYVRAPAGATLQLATTPGGAAINLTAAHAGTVHVYRIADAWVAPSFYDQFDYDLIGLTGTGAVVLPLSFGDVRDGTLLGLKLTCTSGANAGQSRIITGYINRTREATLNSAFISAIGATDRFTIAPQSGAFDRYALFLPWCMTEAGNTANRVNPFPPGFNYPNHWSTPQSYRWDAGVGQGLMLDRVAYHSTLAVHLQQMLGEEILVLGLGIGGASLARNEFPAAVSSDFGWFDAAQMSCFAPGEVNSCFQRVCDIIDASVAALALEGHTLQIELVSFMQGETDGLSEQSATNYYANCRTLFAALRNFIKSRGLWPRSAETLPIVHPQILEGGYGGAWPFATTINAAKRQIAAIDPYTRAPVTNGLETDVGGVHYNGRGMAQLAQLIRDEFRDIRESTDPAGEIAICNSALNLLGDVAQLTSIDPTDGSTQSNLCAAFYAKARDEALETGQFSFAMKRVAGEALDESPNTNWAFGYRRPASALKVVAVLPADLGDDYPALGEDLAPVRETMTTFLRTGASPTSSASSAYQFAQEQLGDSLVILSNVEDAVLRYVERVIDTRKYSETFRCAVELLLASRLAGPIIGGEAGRAESARLYQLYKAKVAEAGKVDVVQHKIRPDRRAPWHRNR